MLYNDNDSIINMLISKLKHLAIKMHFCNCVGLKIAMQ